MQRLIGGFTRVVRAAADLSWVLILALIIFITADVLMRNMGYPLPGIVESAEMVLVVAVFAALPFTALLGRHVSVDVFVDTLKPRSAALVEASALAAAGLVLAYAAWVSVDAAILSVGRMEYRLGVREVPVWPSRIAVAVGWALMTVVVFARVIKLFRGKSDHGEGLPTSSRGQKG